MKPIQEYWYKPNLIAWILMPFSWLYCFIVYVRRKLYQNNILKSYTHEIPVVIIGNIVVGGTGKTPLIISLCHFLQGRNIKVGIVSRGYGGSVSGVHQIKQSDVADSVGDEPLMIYRTTGVPVVIGSDRVAAVDYLLENNPCDIVLSDDGLQHYRLRRDFEVAVIDSARRFGNGYCIPAGPLREPKARLDEVDMVVYNNTDQSETDPCSYTLQLGSCTHIDGVKHQELKDFMGKTVHAVAGIGHPQRFFDSLREMGLTIIEHPFPDHHTYLSSDFSTWQKDCIIMTEKDAVKCQNLPLPDAWSAGVTAVFSDELEQRFSKSFASLLS